MNNAVLYFAITCASLFFVQHLVARIQIARAALISPEDRRKGLAMANRGMIEGAVSVGLFTYMLWRGVGAIGMAVAIVLGAWLFFGYCRITRKLILLQSLMQLTKRTAKGGAMNSGALASMVSGGVGLAALVWVAIISQPRGDEDWAQFRDAHDCKIVEADAPDARQRGGEQKNKTAWRCKDGTIHYR